MKKLYLIIPIILFWTASAFADTHAAVDCSKAEVDIAIAAAVTGDTVVVPAGTCEWATAVTVPLGKSITIQGQTSTARNATAYDPDTNPTGYSVVPTDLTIIKTRGFSVSEPNNVRITGFTFCGNTVDHAVCGTASVGTNITITPPASTVGMRIDHNHFVHAYKVISKPAVASYKGILIDNNRFTDPIEEFIYLTGGGNQSWINGGTCGSSDPEKTIWIEDNEFILETHTVGNPIDMGNGARAVIRGNRFTDGSGTNTFSGDIIEAHGHCQGMRDGDDNASAYCLEVSDNLQVASDTNHCWNLFVRTRGGRNYVYNNKHYGHSPCKNTKFWVQDTGSFPDYTCNGTNHPSTTELTIGVASQTLTTTTGLGTSRLVVNDEVWIASLADTSNNMYGTITSYNTTTGELVVNVSAVNGSGTYASWGIFRETTGNCQVQAHEDFGPGHLAYHPVPLRTYPNTAPYNFGGYCDTYPCPMQPNNSYVWNNTWSGGSVTVSTVNAYTAVNRDWWDDVTGVFTKDVAANRNPTTCTAEDSYWETDNKILYRCTSTNTWTAQYAAYTYPHPLQGGPTHALTVTKDGTGSGIVTSSPAGVNCGISCNPSFVEDTEVTLTASVEGNNAFTAWTGEGCSGTGTCVVTMGAARAVTATFTDTTPTNYIVTVAYAGTGIGVTDPVAGPHAYALNDTATTTQTPGDNSTFTAWSGTCGCTGSGACAPTITADCSIIATWADNTKYSLTVTYPTNGETVTADTGEITCGNYDYTCQDSYYSGTVTLSCDPATYWYNCTFTGCTDGVCSMTENKEVSVTSTNGRAATGVGTGSATMTGIGTGGGVITIE